MNHQRGVPSDGVFVGAARVAFRRNARVAVVWGLMHCAGVVLTGCATPPAGTSEMHPESMAMRRASAVAAPPVVDAAIANKILALNPRHITERDLALWEWGLRRKSFCCTAAFTERNSS